MKLPGVLIIAIILPCLISGQEINKEFTDEKSGKQILVGACDIPGLKQNESIAENFKSYYGDYKPDEVILSELSSGLEGISITLVLGTWCHDSHEQVPRFIKILQLVDFDKNNLRIIAVDREKKAGDINIRKLKIKRVPTFIFYRGNKKLGRIIETLDESLEADMLKILN